MLRLLAAAACDAMSWAKLDDNFHSHPKIRAALTRDPGAVALHALAISYSANHETDGHIAEWFPISVFPQERQRQCALDTLAEVGLWHPNGDGYLIHDYLNYNPSKSELEAKRADNRERVRRHRAGGNAD